jgi:Arc/MetJ-type ribon-helix-helix transcriptional regulator
MATEKTTIVVSCRVSEKLAEMIKKHCENDMHVNIADFVRDAIREKLERDSRFLREASQP